MRIVAIIRADYLQRIRSPKFGFVLLSLAFLTFLMFPGVNAKYAVINIYGYRGLYNSAWIGDTLAVLGSLTMPLIFFYLIKNTITLDRTTKLDALLKSSTLKNHTYVLGKWFSNICLLVTFLLLMNAVATLKQLYLGESYEINLIAQFNSQIRIALPAMLVTASFALLFESLPILRGGFGNLIYIYVWMPVVMLQVKHEMGAGRIISQFQVAVDNVGRLNNHMNIGGSSITSPLSTITWQGTRFDGAVAASSLYLIYLALVVLLITILFFRHQRVGFQPWRLFKEKTVKIISTTMSNETILTPLGARRQNFGTWQLLRGELQLMFRSQGLIWFAGLIFVTLSPFFLPPEKTTAIILPLAGIWGALIHSQLGCRDVLNNTTSLVSCTLYGEKARLVTSWLAGVVLQLTLFAGMIIYFAFLGQFILVFAMLGGALFIPAMAISLGRISSTNRTFEFLFMLLWYAGPVDRITALDFLGTTHDMATPPVLGFLSVTAILMVVTVFTTQKK